VRKADIKSLIWLTRWYNGSASRMEEIHQSHHFPPAWTAVGVYCPDVDRRLARQGFVNERNLEVELIGIRS